MITLKKTDIKKIVSVFERNMPDPVIELEYNNDFTFLIAVILSAQATDIQVNKITSVLFQYINTPQCVIKLGLEELTKMVSSINYYSNKAKFIYKLSHILIDQYNSQVPKDRDTLCTLPGVGRKTANVFLNEIYKLPTLGVDTHITRVSRRLLMSSATKPERIEDDLLILFQDFDSEVRRKLHRWLVLHGRYTCKAKKPKCGSCDLYTLCPSEERIQNA